MVGAQETKITSMFGLFLLVSTGNRGLLLDQTFTATAGLLEMLYRWALDTQSQATPPSLPTIRTCHVHMYICTIQFYRGPLSAELSAVCVWIFNFLSRHASKLYAPIPSPFFVPLSHNPLRMLPMNALLPFSYTMLHPSTWSPAIYTNI